MLRAIKQISKISLIAVFIAGAQLSFGAASTTQASGPDGICTDLSATNDYVITESQVLLSHDIGGAVFERDLSANPIPAGEYNISALSYEPQHPNDPIPGQLEESWRVELYSGADLVFASAATIDIPDADQTTLTDFGQGVEITSDVDRIVYIHDAFPESDPDRIWYHSVIPACVAFDEVEQPPVVCQAVVTIDEQNPLKVTVDLTAQNADNVSYVVEWGDNTSDDVVGDSVMHTYEAAGTYTIVVNTIVNDEVVANCGSDITVTDAVGGGGVLGVTDTPEPAVEPATTTGQVLAATGVSSVVSVLAGIAIFAVAAGMYYLPKRLAAKQ